MNHVRVDIETWPYRQDVSLSRFLFATRSPLPLPNGFHYSGPLEALGTGHSTDDVNWVSLVVHQVVGGSGQGLRAAEAVRQVEFQGVSSSLEFDPATAPQTRETWSVVEALTPDEITVVPESEMPARSRTWAQDPFMRVVHVLRQLVRAERVATQCLSAIPAYEQVLHPILAFRATGEQLLESAEHDARVIATLSPEWGEPLMLVLEHENVSLDSNCPRPEASQFDPTLNKWLVDLELEHPGLLWRERLLDARQQLHVEGRYDLAVILFATATEVLIDGLLQMLWWEKSLKDPQTTAATVAGSFDSTKDSIMRMNKHLTPLLGGNWSSPSGPAQKWKIQTWKLRHRCVHGGYYPTHAEAVAASHSSDEIATFMFDRLADKRASFPRVSLQVLAQGGLEKRDKWDGQIKRFAENEAQQERSWNLALKAFREQVEVLRQ